MPGDLEETIAAFIDHYNYRRYHEGLGDVTPYGVYTGIHLKIIQRGKEAKSRTLQARRDYRITIEPPGSRTMASDYPLTQWSELSHFC